MALTPANKKLWWGDETATGTNGSDDPKPGATQKRRLDDLAQLGRCRADKCAAHKKGGRSRLQVFRT